VCHGDLHAASPDLRILEHLTHRVDGAARHGMLLQQLHPGPGAARERHAADHLHQLGSMGQPRRIAPEALVLGPFVPACGLAETGKLAIIAHGQNHVAVFGRELLVGHRVRMRVAHALRHLVPVQIVHALVGQTGHADIEQSQIYVLAAPVCSRACRAARIAVLAYSPVRMSVSATPTFMGRASGLAIGMARNTHQPPMPWIRKS
jgi:hypothetical protein